MTSVVDCFIQAPSETMLEHCTKQQLWKIDDHFNIKTGANQLKETVRSILKANLIEEGFW